MSEHKFHSEYRFHDIVMHRVWWAEVPYAPREGTALRRLCYAKLWVVELEDDQLILTREEHLTVIERPNDGDSRRTGPKP